VSVYDHAPRLFRYQLVVASSRLNHDGGVQHNALTSPLALLSPPMTKEDSTTNANIVEPQSARG
jgi:homogentisate 1,2-dioxygenase